MNLCNFSRHAALTPPMTDGTIPPTSTKMTAVRSVMRDTSEMNSQRDVSCARRIEKMDLFKKAVSVAQIHADAMRQKEAKRKKDADRFLQQIDLDRTSKGMSPYTENVKTLARIAFEAGWAVRDVADNKPLSII